MEMLEDSIKRYQNKVITAAEVIEELIELSKRLRRWTRNLRRWACPISNTHFIRPS